MSSIFDEAANMSTMYCGCAYEEDYNKEMTWSEILQKYPDKGIIFKDMSPTGDSRFFTCVLLCVCSADIVKTKVSEFRNENVHAQFLVADNIMF